MNAENDSLPVYDLSINLRVGWQAHSLSNVGDDGSIRLLPRRQYLADGKETDACSGNILKHHHAVLMAEYLEAEGSPLCPACRRRDSRRAGALSERPEFHNIAVAQVLNECALCDAHGFLVTAKKAAGDGSTEARQRLSKHTIIDFAYALGIPGLHRESPQLHTRSGGSKDEGQMLMKLTSRSGTYALCIRYHCVRIGVDTEQWQLAVDNEQERLKRYRSALRALRDMFTSPEGARTATMLPHLTELSGAIVLCRKVGRAPVYSALADDYLTRLQAMQGEECQIYSFETIDGFYKHLTHLSGASEPALPSGAQYSQTQTEVTNERGGT